MIIPEGSDISAFLKSVFEFAPFTVMFNATGQPAVSLPVHWSDEDVPVGVQFAAKYGREDILFRLAAYLEKETGWARKQKQLLTRLCA